LCFQLLSEAGPWHRRCDSLWRPPKTGGRRVEMKKAIRIALGSAVLAGGLAVAGASPANAQVRFRGSFPLPHGRISIGVGDGGYGYGGFGGGGYVPHGYNGYEDPGYGHGVRYE